MDQLKHTWILSVKLKSVSPSVHVPYSVQLEPWSVCCFALHSNLSRYHIQTEHHASIWMGVHDGILDAPPLHTCSSSLCKHWVKGAHTRWPDMRLGSQEIADLKLNIFEDTCDAMCILLQRHRYDEQIWLAYTIPEPFKESRNISIRSNGPFLTAMADRGAAG